jgi:VWFA-related protein
MRITIFSTTIRLSAALLFMMPLLAPAQQPAVPAPGQNNPALVQRPARTLRTNRIQLNVVVTDQKGVPVSGLTQQDFTLLDDKHPRTIVSFHAYDASTQKPAPPVQVILLLDMVNIDFHDVAYARQQLGKFLAENGGHLAQPVSLFLLTNHGVSIQPEPSMDGNAEAGALNEVDSELRTITQSAGVYGAIERFQLSLRSFSSIVQMEAAKPGRKLLVWIGPGWPMLSGMGFSEPSTKEQEQNFNLIVAFSTQLRESQISLYNVQGGEPDAYSQYYRSFLKGVQSPRQEDNADLDVKVLATQSGGLSLGPANDLAEQIDKCVRDASAFYTIAFDPPPAEKPDEYHDLKIEIDKPHLTARTTTGYYNQPHGLTAP